MLKTLNAILAVASIASAQCPYGGGASTENPHELHKRDTPSPNAATEKFLSQYELDDTDAYITTDAGGPISDSDSLSAGERGPTLLEDFIFRQKIQHFDHERVYITRPLPRRSFSQ